MLAGTFPFRRTRFLSFMIFPLVMVFLNVITPSYAFWPGSGTLETNVGTVKPGVLPESDSDSVREIIEEAKQLAAAGNIDQAIEKYTDAVNRSPKDPVLYFARGTLYYQRVMTQPLVKEQGTVSPLVESTTPQPETAPLPVRDPLTGTVAQCGLSLSDFDQAIALNPNYAIFFYMRGIFLTVEVCPHRNLEAAVADFDQALKLNPANAAFYQERGSTRGKLKQFDRAMNDINQAILIEPNNYYFFYEKGQIQEQMGKPADAAENYLRALTFAPPDQLALFIAALKAVRNNNPRTLIADFSALITKRPAVSAFYVQRGMLFAEGKKWESAIADFSTAVSLQSGDSDLQFGRGKLFYEAGKKTDALKDFQTACRLQHAAACHYEKMVAKEMARGDRWVPFWYAKDNQKYLYDQKHLKTQDGNRKFVRVRIESGDMGLEKPADAGHMALSDDRNGYTLEWWEFKCSSSQLRISRRSRLNEEGQVIESFTEFEKAFRPVSSGDISNKLARVVCGKAGSKKTKKKSVSSRQDERIFSP